MPDHHQFALDDDGHGHVEVLIRLAGGEYHDAQNTGRAGCFYLHAAVNLVAGAAGNEHEASGARLDAIRVQVGQSDGAGGGGADGQVRSVGQQ